MSDPPPWWPHRAASHRLRVAPHDWHVQVFGTGPDVMLLHGAGASGASWRRLVPLLPGYRLIVPDLPGQGFTRAGRRTRLGPAGLAADLAALAAAQGWQPAALVGHSAGGALAFRLAEALARPPAALAGINAALSPFEGIAGWLFPRLARAMALTPALAAAAARATLGPEAVARLIRATGSAADSETVAIYAHLARQAGHVEGTLAMMAQWDLGPIVARLPQTAAPVLLVAAAGDRAVPPAVSRRAAAAIPGAVLAELPRLGHLAHEEAAPAVAARLAPFLARHLHPAGTAGRPGAAAGA